MTLDTKGHSGRLCVEFRRVCVCVCAEWCVNEKYIEGKKNPTGPPDLSDK